MLQPEREKEEVYRVLANQTLGSTVSLLTSNIPFAWFLVLGRNRQEREAYNPLLWISCDIRKENNLRFHKDNTLQEIVDQEK